MSYQFYIVDVFNETAFGGNQLAVFPDAQGLTPDEMQKIAREFNFSETTFVLPPEDNGATARIRIFTPYAEVDFAGHPTIGTACALVHGGHTDPGRLLLAENVGPIPVDVERREEVLYATLSNSSTFEYVAEAPAHTGLARVLSLQPCQIEDAFFASAGLRCCFVQLADRETVDAAAIDKAAWAECLAKEWSSNLFFFSGDLKDGSEIYARMSAPGLGVDEDPATGSAAAALAGVVAIRTGRPSHEVSIDVLQGVAMGRPGQMSAGATISEGVVASVRVGGAAVVFAKGELVPSIRSPRTQ